MGDLNVDGRAHDDKNRKETRDKWGAWGEEDLPSAEYHTMMQTFLDTIEGAQLRGHTAEDSYPEGVKPKEAKSSSQQSCRPVVVEVSDLCHLAYGGINPVTIGDVVVDEVTGDLSPKETVLTDPVTDMLSRSCLDYAIHFKPKGDLHGRRRSSRREKVRVNVKATKVEQFPLDPREIGFPCRQISDHYGISTSFVLQRRITDE